jgi:phospholipid/cholesterol/gamma-HCH transport system substrate-binding protein
VARRATRRDPGPERPSGERGASTPARMAAVLAVLAAFLVAVLLLFGGDGGHQYKLLFQTGGQLVPGNEVLVGGQPVGTIDKIDLTDDAQASISVTMDEPLREGTSAVIRSTSLSGVANRYISLTPGPNNMDEIPDGETITGEDTTAPVDLDQLFNVFHDRERKALQKFIQGNATVYTGKTQLANRAYKFLNPALSSSERLFAEISSDSVALEKFLVSGSQAFGALAERRDDLTSLVTNANATLQAISNRNDELDRSLAALPQTLRQGNTTFVNLRAALDDLDPLVAASKPATKNLAPFLRRLRLVSTNAVPVFSDLSDVVSLPGKPNDVADTLAELPQLESTGHVALPAAVDAMNDSQDNVAFLRPYTPDVLGWLSKFGQTTAYYDANGHYARAMPAASNVFDYEDNGPAQDTLDPAYVEPAGSQRQFEDIQTLNPITRCPGAGSPPAPDGSNPFSDDGNLIFGTGAGADCDPNDIPPSP